MNNWLTVLIIKIMIVSLYLIYPKFIFFGKKTEIESFYLYKTCINWKPILGKVEYEVNSNFCHFPDKYSETQNSRNIF